MLNKLFELKPEFGSGTQLEYNVSKFFEDNILLKEYYPYQYNSWKDHKKYGILNTKNIAIYPRTSFLKDHTNDNGYTGRNLNFVTDAFLDLKKAMNDLQTKTIINNAAGIYTRLNAVETYVDSPNMYITHLNSIFNIFNKTYLTDEQKNSIIDVYSFVPVFIAYIKNVIDFVPLNRQTYLRSNLVPDNATGLVISFDNTVREDQFMTKTNKYIGNNYFDIFLQMAGRFGFYVNRNSPWKIIADLDSPIMIDYAKKYGLSSVEDIFDNYYHEAYKVDLTVLKSIFINFWNTYCSESSVVTRVDNVKGCNKLFSETITLQPITEQIFDNYFSINWLIRLYFYTRCLEEKVNISQNKFEVLFQEACKINNFINLDNCLLFINTKVYELPTKISNSTTDLTPNDSLARLVSTNQFRVSSTDIKF